MQNKSAGLIYVLVAKFKCRTTDLRTTSKKGVNGCFNDSFTSPTFSLDPGIATIFSSIVHVDAKEFLERIERVVNDYNRAFINGTICQGKSYIECFKGIIEELGGNQEMFMKAFNFLLVVTSFQ